MKFSARQATGFTLIEVLAAIALLAIAFAIGLGALGKSAQNAAHAVALDTAVERAQSLLAEQGLATPLKAQTTSGSFADGSHWTLRIHLLPRPTPRAGGDAAGDTLAQASPGGAMVAQAAAIDLYQLDVSVDYGAGRVLRLATLRAQAAPEGQQ